MAEILFDAATTMQIQPHSCEECRFRKLKCNRQKPCGRCVDKSFSCTYVRPAKKIASSRKLSEILRQQSDSNIAGSSSTQSPNGIDGENTSFSSLAPSRSFQIGTGMEETTVWDARNGAEDEETALASNSANEQFFLNPDLDPSQYDDMSWIDGATGTEEIMSGIYQEFLGQSDLPVAQIQSQDMSLALRVSSTAIGIGSSISEPESFDWPASLDDSALLSTIDIFDRRISSTIPVFSRGYLLKGLLSGRHRTDSTYGAMLLALHAFILVQPIQTGERSSISDRMEKAKFYMTESLRMRSTSDKDSSSVESVMTSFFLFGCLFGRGEHNGAWLRLREAISLGEISGLHDSDSYAGLDSEEKERRMRAYWLLSVTERAYALQRNHSINFVGKVSASLDFESGTRLNGNAESQKTSAHGLRLMVQLFDTFDEGIIECWKGTCQRDGSLCQLLRPQQMVTLARMLREFSIDFPLVRKPEHPNNQLTSSYQANSSATLNLDDHQQADVLITQQWLRNRLWKLGSTHGLLHVEHSCSELRYDLAVEIGCTTLDMCEKMNICSLEVHGIGIVEKIYDIALGVLQLLPSPATGLIEPRISGPFNELIIHEGSPGLNASLLSSYFQEKHAATCDTFIRQLANRFLAFFALFRGGLHRFLSMYMTELAKRGP